MSFAISTVLLFIIVAPGLVARFCYFTFPFANKVRSIDFITEVFWSVIPGFIIQFLGVGLVERFSSFRVSFPIIGALLMGTRDGNDQQMGSIMDNIHHSLFPILLYNLFILAAAAVTGFGLKWVVRRWGWDKRWEFFRFNNKWFYILSGEIIDIENSGHGSENISLTGLDLLCRVGNENIIYVGSLASYYLTRSGDLDAILIRYPFRRKLENDKPDDTGNAAGDNARYYQIPSDYLYIPAKDIINLNIRYYDLE